MTARWLAPFLAAALGGTLLIAPSTAAADDDDDDAPRKKKRMTVTVEDNEDVDAEETEAVAIKSNRKRKRPDPPEIGAPPAEVEVYLSELKAEADIAKEKAKAAKRSGDEDREAELRLEAQEAKAFYAVERDRLTERNVGMIAGGGTLVGLGVASFVASFVLVIGWGLSSIDGNPDDEYGWASLGCLGGTLVGIGAGTPLIVIGSIREPKQASDAKVTPPAPFGVGTGIAVTVPF
jgi:hypothetical protein